MTPGLSTVTHCELHTACLTLASSALNGCRSTYRTALTLRLTLWHDVRCYSITYAFIHTFIHSYHMELVGVLCLSHSKPLAFNVMCNWKSPPPMPQSIIIVWLVIQSTSTITQSLDVEQAVLLFRLFWLLFGVHLYDRDTHQRSLWYWLTWL